MSTITKGITVIAISFAVGALMPQAVEAQSCFSCCRDCDFAACGADHNGFDQCSTPDADSCNLSGSGCGSLVLLAPDGSLLSSALQSTIARDENGMSWSVGFAVDIDDPVHLRNGESFERRACDGAILARHYTGVAAANIRRTTKTLKI